MLKEIIPTRQIHGEPRRVWFMDDQMDLIVWFSGEQRIIGFQLCANKGQDEHALTWFQGKRYSYHRVDDGEGRPGGPKMAPILVSGGAPDVEALLSQFADKDDLLPEAVRGFVEERLEELRNLANKAL